MIEREKLAGKFAQDRQSHFSPDSDKLKEKHNIIGDVRGKGLMLGIELVKDRTTKEPAKAECAQVLENCRDMGLLVRQRRSAGADDPLFAADVHSRAGRGFSARRFG